MPKSSDSEKRINQAMMVHDYMKDHGSITSYEAIMSLGVLDCPKRISELRRMGYKIDKDWKTLTTRSGVKTHVRVYSLAKDEVGLS